MLTTRPQSRKSVVREGGGGVNVTQLFQEFTGTRGHIQDNVCRGVLDDVGPNG